MAGGVDGEIASPAEADVDAGGGDGAAGAGLDVAVGVIERAGGDGDVARMKSRTYASDGKDAGSAGDNRGVSGDGPGVFDGDESGPAVANVHGGGVGPLRAWAVDRDKALGDDSEGAKEGIGGIDDAAAFDAEVADAGVRDIERGGVKDSAGGDEHVVVAAADPADVAGGSGEGAVENVDDAVVADVVADFEGGVGGISESAGEGVGVALEIESDIVLEDGELVGGDVGVEGDGGSQVADTEIGIVGDSGGDAALPVCAERE
jgi:hypothetical protein